MPHPERNTASTLLPLIPAVHPTKVYVVLTVLCFLCVSTLALLAFGPRAAAEELAPEAPGSIAGTVKNSKGEPQVDIAVTLYQFTTNNTPPWRGSRTMTTQADGQYRFALLPAGIYRVGTTDPQRTYAPTYYPATPTLATATDLSVVGNQLTKVDVALQLGGTLTGVVMVTGSLPITEGYVDLYQEVERSDGLFWESVQRLPLPTTGIYSFTGLSPLPYRICANVVNPIFFWYECYLNADIDTATSLTVTPGATISNINLVLGDIVNVSSARFGGRVTSLDNEPLANIEIYARPLGQNSADDRAGAFPPQHNRSIIVPGFYTRTDQKGIYAFAASGRYVLSFKDLSGQYAYEYYDNATVSESATIVEVAENTIITNLNVQLAPASHLQGATTLFGQPAPDGSVTAERKTPFGWDAANSAQIDAATGRYNIGGLPPGVYRLTATSYANGWDNPYVGYFGGNTLETAAGITLAVGVTTTADITLSGEPAFAGSVSGQVTANGAPLAGAKVYLYGGVMDCCKSVFPQPLVYVFTDAEGRYIINGLTTTLYWIGAVDPTGAYATTYHPRQATPALAGSLYIEDGAAFTDTNIAMPLAGAISGRVLMANGKAVAGLRVAVYAADPTFEPGYYAIRLVASDTRTDAEGRYRIQGLHATTYYVCFSEVQSNNYGECYGRPTANYDDVGGTPVNVAAGATTAGIDLIWGPDPGYYLPLIAR